MDLGFIAYITVSFIHLFDYVCLMIVINCELSAICCDHMTELTKYSLLIFYPVGKHPLHVENKHPQKWFICVFVLVIISGNDQVFGISNYGVLYCNVSYIFKMLI